MGLYNYGTPCISDQNFGLTIPALLTLKNEQLAIFVGKRLQDLGVTHLSVMASGVLWL